MGIIADGIEATHQTTHRCSCDNVYGQASLLDHLQCADMGNTLGTTSTEYNGHLLPGEARHDRHHCQQ